MTKPELSLITAPLTAVLVGFASSVAVVIAAMQAVGANQMQISSGLAAMCVAIALSSTILCHYYRLPLLSAWSLPGSAVMAAVEGVDYAVALMACLAVGVLLMLSALVPVFSRWIERLPLTIAAAMLAGILFRFVVAVFPNIGKQPVLCLVVLAVFFLARQWRPMYAVILAMVIGGVLAFAMDTVGSIPSLTFSAWVWTPPAWSLSGVIGLALPVYLVTMVSQNLTGAAVLRASGYQHIPTRASVGLTGLCTVVVAPFGGLPINLAAVTAAICTGEDCHADPQQRWRCGLYYGIFYTLLALSAAALWCFLTVFRRR